MALKQLYQMVHQQGVVMAFADVFLLLSLLYVAFAWTDGADAPPCPDGAGAGGH